MSSKNNSVNIGDGPAALEVKCEVVSIPDYVLETLDTSEVDQQGAEDIAHAVQEVAPVAPPARKAANGYHHGDLRAAVIAAGMTWLSEGDGVDLGLRALAREVGVSATALYRHFPDKESLLDALAEEGIRRLGAVQAQAWLKAGGGKEGFKATGIAYVRFAFDEPSVFRLSFTRRMRSRLADEASDGSEIAYNLLRAGVTDAVPWMENPDRAALHAWALVHGLAMLVLDRRVEWDAEMIEDVVGMTFGGIG